MSQGVVAYGAASPWRGPLRRSLPPWVAAASRSPLPASTVALRGAFPVQSFDFLGYAFRPRQAVWHGSRYVTSFLPAASPKALKVIRQTIRRWAFHHRTDKSLEDLARMFRPYIQGWINYY